MFGLDAPELIIISIVILVLFGSKKLPDAARALGRSMRIFKAETREMKADEKHGVHGAIEPAQPEVTRPNPASEIPVAAPLTPDPPPVTEPRAGSPLNEPR